MNYLFYDNTYYNQIGGLWYHLYCFRYILDFTDNFPHGMQVIEIGKGSKVKYELDKKTGLIKVTN